LIDNSGSMLARDGVSFLRAESGALIKRRVTRWTEATEALLSAAEIADELDARLDVHLANPTIDAHLMSLGGTADDSGIGDAGAERIDVERLREVLQQSPSGTSPLASSIDRIVPLIEPAAEALRARGQRVAVLIATDATPDDEASFRASFERLKALPVWVVVRLCTRDADVVSYWNKLDAELEAPLEVLGDLASEAEEIQSSNAWLNYCAPLHEARTFGLSERLYDLLDEGEMLPSEVKLFCERLFDVSLPEPELNPAVFVDAVGAAQVDIGQESDPNDTAVKRPWVDVAQLKAHIEG